MFISYVRIFVRYIFLNGSINNLNTAVSINECDSVKSIVEIMRKNKGKIGTGEVGYLQQSALKGVLGNIPDGANYVNVYARNYLNVFIILLVSDRYSINIAINFISYVDTEYVTSGWATIIKGS